MGMHWLENELRNTGNPTDIERAEIIAAMLRNRGEDIPLPQVIEASGQDEETQLLQPAAMVGSLALYSSIEEEASKPVNEILIENENLAHICQTIDATIEPYNGLFFGKLPTNVEQGRLFSAIRKSNNISWKIEREERELLYEYKFNLNYSTTIYGRFIDKVLMEAENQLHPPFYLGIDFNRGRMSGLSLGWKEAKYLFMTEGGYRRHELLDSSLYDHLNTQNNMLSEMVKMISPLLCDRSTAEDARKYKGDTNIQLYFGLGPIPNMQISATGGRKRVLEQNYRYNEGENNFTATAGNQSLIFGYEIDPEQYLGLLENALGLIPTAKLQSALE